MFHNKTGVIALLIILVVGIRFSEISTIYAQNNSDGSNDPNRRHTHIYIPIVTEPEKTATPTPPPSPTQTTPPSPTQTPPPPGQTKVYYLSTTGNDSLSGLSEAQAWATFNHAWQFLYPGDTLILLDGTYYQSLAPNVRDGNPGYPITIKALNDGKAIIDGQNARLPVSFGYTFPIGNYFNVEGIIAQNSSSIVFMLQSNHDILRRVSAYNANTNGNNEVYVITGSYNLVEDCIAAGTGRKMVLIFSGKDPQGQHNTIRRCFASYHEWDGRNWGGSDWPWDENFEAYSADYNTFENDIAYGNFANAGFSLLAQGGGDTNEGNKILGSIAIMGDIDFQGNPTHWGAIRPQTTSYTNTANQYEPCQRTGVYIGHGTTSIIQNNLLQDFISWGNASVGICVAETPQLTNDVLNRVTIFNNGLNLPIYNNNVDARLEDLSGLTISNSRIDVIKESGYPYRASSPITGEGARLQYQYVDGVLKDGSDGTSPQLLWPWPMESRIRNELGISVTNVASDITHQAKLANPVSPMPDTSLKYPNTFLSSSPTIIAFGNVTTGSIVTQTITLKNLGNATLSITTYQLVNQSSNGFSIVSGGTCAQLPFSLASQQSCTVKISFSPHGSGPQSANIDFISPQAQLYPGTIDTYLSGSGN